VNVEGEGRPPAYHYVKAADSTSTHTEIEYRKRGRIICVVCTEHLFRVDPTAGLLLDRTPPPRYSAQFRPEGKTA
jgi:hypothetical protein